MSFYFKSDKFTLDFLSYKKFSFHWIFARNIYNIDLKKIFFRLFLDIFL